MAPTGKQPQPEKLSRLPDSMLCVLGSDANAADVSRRQSTQAATVSWAYCFTICRQKECQDCLLELQDAIHVSV